MTGPTTGDAIRRRLASFPNKHGGRSLGRLIYVGKGRAKLTLMGWDELDENGPPIITGPRSVPPVRRDAEAIARRNRALAALARIRSER